MFFKEVEGKEVLKTAYYNKKLFQLSHYVHKHNLLLHFDWLIYGAILHCKNNALTYHAVHGKNFKTKS